MFEPLPRAESTLKGDPVIEPLQRSSFTLKLTNQTYLKKAQRNPT